MRRFSFGGPTARISSEADGNFIWLWNMGAGHTTSHILVGSLALRRFRCRIMKKGQDPSNRLLKHGPPARSRGIFNRSSKPGMLHDDKRSDKETNTPSSATPKPPAAMALAATRNLDDARSVRRSIDNAARPQGNPNDKREKNKPLPSAPPDQLRNNTGEGTQDKGTLN